VTTEEIRALASKVESFGQQLVKTPPGHDDYSNDHFFLSATAFGFVHRLRRFAAALEAKERAQ
jgi:hypothetical protein